MNSARRLRKKARRNVTDVYVLRDKRAKKLTDPKAYERKQGWTLDQTNPPERRKRKVKRKISRVSRRRNRAS